MPDRKNATAKCHPIEIILGPAGSGKTAACLKAWASFGPRGLLLVPTPSAAMAMEERLASQGLLPLWGRAIMTPEQLATWIIRKAGRSERRLLTPTLKALLLREIVERLDISYLRNVQNRAGFYRALAELISELKAAGISPAQFEQVCQARKAHLAPRRALANKDTEVARIYAAFQQRLEQRGWAEKEDLIAEAASLLKQNPNLLAKEFDALLADGFWEFSEVEASLLNAISSAVQTAKVTLPWEDERDALAYTDQTLTHLVSRISPQHTHTHTLTHSHTPRAGSLAHLERHIFLPPSNENLPAITDQGIVFLEAPGLEGEVEMVAREIRLLMAQDDGIPPEAILVLSPNLPPYSRHIQRYFREFAIPFSLPAELPLLEIPLVRTLDSLLRVLCDGWQRRDVLALLKSGYLPIEPEKANWVQMEAQRRGVFRGREEWLRNFTPGSGSQAVAQGFSPADIPDAGRPKGLRYNGSPGSPSLAALAAEASQQKQRALGLVRQVEEALGDQPTAAAFRAALLSWTKDSAVQKNIAAADPEPVRLDGLALLRVDELLREMEETVGAQARTFSLWELAEWLRVAMATTTVEAPPQAKGVTCLSVEQARHLEGEVVFLLGLNEKEFPPPPRQEPFYADWEREDGRQLGPLGLRTSHQQMQREKLLFYSAVTRASKRLYLCRSHTDSEGKECPESAFLSDLKSLFSPESVRLQTKRRAMSTVVPEEPLTQGDWLNFAILKSAEAAVPSAVAAGLPTTDHRPLTTALAEVARVANWEPQARLRPDEFALPSMFSPSSLETYASCPFRFFAEEILRLKPPEVEIGPREKGQLLHRVMSRLLQQEKDWREERKEALLRKAREVLDQEAKASGYGRRDERGYRLGLLREALLLLLERFVEEELRLRLLLPEFRPAHFELSFGYNSSNQESGIRNQAKASNQQPTTDNQQLTTSTTDPASTAQPLTISGSIFIRGRIDRLDLEEGTNNCTIYDYKSGKTEFNTDEMNQGTCLQIPLYLLAAADIWGLQPLAGLFHSREGASSGILWQQMVHRLGFRPARKKRLVVSDLQQVREKVVPVVENLVNNIREAIFPPQPGEGCRWCLFPSLCRQETPRL